MGDFRLNEKPYRMPQDLDTFLNLEDEFRVVHTYEKTGYVNLPAAFDIETTSFYDNGEKRATMYIWQFGINGNVIIGRTWKEFVDLIEALIEVYSITPNQRFRIYVHNLAFEFQFLRKWFTWDKIFAVSERTPLFARTTSGIEFSCSYLLSGYRLEDVGNQLQKYPVRKLTGSLDYSWIRNSETVLTDKELAYCVNDVLVVMAYIQEEIERNENSIANIPFTKTGYVRRYCRKACQKGGKRFKIHRELMDALTLEADEYDALKAAFQGGFTHANPRYSGKICYDVHSFDFTSSYPYVMLSEKFPMSKGRIVEVHTVKELEDLCSRFCVLFELEINGLRSIFWNDNYISESKCYDTEGVVTNNGRVVDADRIRITITDVDWFIIKTVYRYDSLAIGRVWVYDRGYLPKPLLKSIIELYKNKTTLKGIEEKTTEYQVSKGMLNAVYGMIVTDIVRDVISYEGNEWQPLAAADKEASIRKSNRSKSRFLFYPWGVWITAYARRNLWSGILACKEDYIYSDTDSIKLLHLDRHIQYFSDYNQAVVQKLTMMCDYYNIDFDDLQPETIKGEKKLIGIWDWETSHGAYSRFKTLGAKRYMLEHPGALVIRHDDGTKDEYDVSLTVSGVNKYAAIPYLISKYGDRIFDVFEDDLTVPADYTGKLTHTYIDDEISGSLKDYQGHVARYEERSCIHLEKAPYHLSLAYAYIDYLKGFRDLK